MSRIVFATLALAALAPSALAAESAEELIERGRYTDAVRAAERALAEAETARALRVLAEAEERAGRPSAALDAARRAVAAGDRKAAPSAERARALTILAKAETALGAHAQARAAAERAVDLAGADPEAKARALVALSEAYRAGGDYARALPAAKQALALDEAERGRGDPDTADSLDQLGLVHASLRDWGAARPLYERALAIREKELGPDHPLTAESLNNLAALLWAVRDYEGARAALERALAIKRRALGDAHPSTATALNNLAEVERARGRNDEAIGLMRQAAQVWQDALGREHPLTATARLNLASTYWRAGRYEQARPEIEEAVRVWRAALGEGHPDTARAENLLAAFYQSSGEHRRALDLYRSGLAAEDRILANVFAVTSEEQKLRFLEQTQGHYYAALSLVQRRFASDPEAVRFALELVLRRKGIVLDAQARAQEALVGRLSGAERDAWQRLSKQRGELAKLLLSGPGQRAAAEYRAEVDRLQAAVADEEEKLGGASALVDTEVAQRRASVAAVAGKLGSGAVLAEFVRIRDWDERRVAWTDLSRYLVFVLSADGRAVMIDLGDARPIDARIAVALEAIKDPRFLEDVAAYVGRTDAALADLHAAIWKPIEPALAGRADVILGPDGEMNKVPFAALRTPARKYLAEDVLLSHVASGRDLLRAERASAADLELFLLANPAFDDSSGAGRGTGPAMRAIGFRGFRYPPLPGTAEEAQVIPGLLGGEVRVLEGAKATEAAVREAPAAKVLHLATHGFFLEDEPEASMPDPLGRTGGFFRGGAAGPMVRSGLALAGANYADSVARGDDGILTALEVSGLDLHATDLVVLSACETALGKVAVGQGVYGLRRAFVLAGAENLVMSLWQVNDKITRDLMERFYRSYGSGHPASQALRAAQLETIAFLRSRTGGAASGGVAPVNLWAPFIVQQTAAER